MKSKKKIRYPQDHKKEIEGEITNEENKIGLVSVSFEAIVEIISVLHRTDCFYFLFLVPSPSSASLFLYFCSCVGKSASTQ